MASEARAVPAWVATLPRYQCMEFGPAPHPTGKWVKYADLVAACPPPGEESRCGIGGSARDVAVTTPGDGSRVSGVDGAAMLRDLLAVGADRHPTCQTHADHPQWTCAFCLFNVLAALSTPAPARQEPEP